MDCSESCQQLDTIPRSCVGEAINLREDHELTELAFTVITENEEHQVFYLNCYHLVYHYIQVFIPDSRQNAVQYLYLLSLYSTTNGYPDQSMVHLARSYVCKYVIDSNDVKTLLGTLNDEQRVS